jgi:exopolysaccharide production protein ExoQ
MNKQAVASETSEISGTLQTSQNRFWDTKLFRRLGATIGVALCGAAATHDIWGMLGYRSKSYRWPSEVTMPFMLTVALSILFRTYALDPQRVRETIRRSAVGITLVALSVASIRWSIDRHETILELRYLIVGSLLGMALATVRPLSILVDGLAVFGVSVVCIGAWFSATDPRFVFDGNWQGLFGNRNGFGAFIAFIWPAVLIASRGSWGRRAVGTTSGALVLWALVQTRSKTALFTVAVVSTLCAVLTISTWLLEKGVTRRKSATGAALISVGLLAFAAIVVGFGLVDLPFAFDRTFTQRTDMWAALLPMAGQEWLHGFGFQAFWTGSRGYLRSAQMVSGKGSELVTAHNGYLHEWLSTGFVGFCLLLTIVAQLIWRGVRSVASEEQGLSSFLLLLGVTFVLQNSMESLFTAPRSLSWFLVSLTLALPNRHNTNNQTSHDKIA